MKMKNYTRAATASLFLAVAVLAYQFVTTMKAVDSAREDAIQAWASANPDSAEAVTRYREICQGGPVEQPTNQAPVRPITIAECAAQLGNESLAEVIEHAADSVVTPAPLRWL